MCNRDTPAAKKQNAIKETSAALQQIYDDHPSAKSTIEKSLGYLVCTGSDSYLFSASTGGGICTLKSSGKTAFYRFASLGVGAGIGYKNLGRKRPSFKIVLSFIACDKANKA